MPPAIDAPIGFRLRLNEAPRGARLAVYNAVVAALYYSTGIAGLALAIPPGFATPVWPPSGIAFAAVWLIGPRILPAVFAGSLAVNLQTSWLLHGGFTLHALAPALGIAAGSTLQTFIAGRMLALLDPRETFGSVRRVYGFAVSAAISCTVAATVGVAALYMLGMLEGQALFTSWLTWCSGDLVGAYLVTPLVVVWLMRPSRAFQVGWTERIAFFLLFFVATLIVRSSFFTFDGSHQRVPYVYVPLMVWSAYRHGTRVMTVFLALASVASVVLAIRLVPATNAFGWDLMHVQLFAGAMTLSGLVLAAAVNEKRSALASARESEERLELALQAASLGTWEWDMPTSQLYWSPGLMKLHGVEARDFGGTFDDFRRGIHPDDRRRVLEEIECSIQAREPYHIEYRALFADGSPRWFEAFGRTFYSAEGQPVRMIGVCKDVSERMQLEEAKHHLIDDLRKAQSDLVLANQSLEQKVGERTALAEARADKLRELAVALTLSEQKERRRLAGILHDHLQQILVAAKMAVGRLDRSLPPGPSRQAVRNVEELLDGAVSASRSLTVELSPPVLRDAGLVPALEWLARWFNEKHEFAVNVVVEDEIGTPTEEIKFYLFQAARELLLNAVKHSGVEEAAVRVSSRDGMIVVAVEDDGRGFDPSAGVPSTGGGLGLVDVRERVELLGGTMEIESAPGRGTRVRLAAPARNAERAAPRAEWERPAELSSPREKRERPIRVLLVDDHSILRQGLANLLAAQPAIVVVGEAASGEEAIAKAADLEPDVVIMDITMPGMNGIEATEKITASYPGIDVIGLSIHDSEDMAATMQRAGARAYLSKHGPADRLIDTILGMPLSRGRARAKLPL